MVRRLHGGHSKKSPEDGMTWQRLLGNCVRKDSEMGMSLASYLAKAVVLQRMNTKTLKNHVKIFMENMLVIEMK